MSNEIIVGKYVIRNSSNLVTGQKAIWIEHESGEGGQFSAESLEKVIHEFYEKNF